MSTKITKKKIALDEPPVEQVQPEEEQIVLTVNGNPIPEAFAHAIPFAHTDQGIAERQNNGKPRAMVEFTRDAWDKKMDQRAAATEPWEAEDPLLEAVDAVKQPGMAYRFLSPRVISKRGMRKYEVVTDGKGNEIKVGNMVLGTMPEDMQARRAKHYQDKGNEDLNNAQENLRVAQEQINRDNPEIGDTTLADGDRLKNYGTGDIHETGITRTRGRAA
jgi:hypothetical protein